MSIIETTTGHSAKGERRIARVLFIWLTAAILFGLLLFFVVGQNKSLSPFKSDDPTKDAPAASQSPAPVAPL